MRNTSHIVIDLSGEGPDALRELGKMEMRHRVLSAVIAGRCSSRCVLKRTLKALGKLPRLAILTLDFEGEPFSIGALLVLLRSAKCVQHLSIRNLVLTPGKESDWQELNEALYRSHIHSLSIHCTHDAVATQAHIFRMMESRNKEGVPGFNQYGRLVKTLLRNLHLDALSLYDIVDEAQVRHLTEFIINNHNLQRLHIRSCVLGLEAGEALVSALHKNRSITDLALNLEGAWGSIGTAISGLLYKSTSLKKLHIRLVDEDFDGVDVARSATHIAKSLASNNTTVLTHLTLEVDLLSLQALKQDRKVIQAFETHLQSNNRLKELKIIDVDNDSVIEDHPLSPNIHMKLALNRSGLGLLLRKGNRNNAQFMESYVKAMGRAAGDVDVLFTALHNNPELFCCESPSQS